MDTLTRRLLPCRTGLWLFVMITAFACGSKSNGQQGKYKLAPNEFQLKLASFEDAQLVDVCTSDEFTKRHIKGAININFHREDFKEAISYLDKSKPTFIYCYAGGRSAKTYDLMQEMGFEEVYELEGGISNWIKGDNPVEQKTIDPNQGMGEDEYNTMVDAGGKVMVVFSTSWCPPCKTLAPIIDEVEKELTPDVLFVRLDGDEHFPQSKRVGAAAFPTLILYEDGKEIWRHQGMIEKEALKKELLR